MTHDAAGKAKEGREGKREDESRLPGQRERERENVSYPRIREQRRRWTLDTHRPRLNVDQRAMHLCKDDSVVGMSKLQMPLEV